MGFSHVRGGPRNSSRGGGGGKTWGSHMSGADLGILRGVGVGGSGQEFYWGGGGLGVQVRVNFHILTSKKNLEGGLNPLPPPPPSATACDVITGAGTVQRLYRAAV